MRNPAEFPFAEALQDDGEPIAPATSGWPEKPSWSADRARARIRLLAGLVGLVGSAMIVAMLVMGSAAHG